jgi:Glyoxalase-like domain
MRRSKASIPAAWRHAQAGDVVSARLDHLVVAARTLDDGVAWCEATLGITPGPGGRHPMMGTHNRLFSIATPAFPRAYFEIIAIDPRAHAPGRARWFDLDDVVLREALARSPQLVHWVARVDDLAAAVAALRARGIDAGRVLSASRDTAQGTLRWQIAVRDDGRRLWGGALPTLIEWAQTHPADAMPASGVTLGALRLRAHDGAALAAALDVLGVAGVPVDAGRDGLHIELQTPRGSVALDSRP